MRSGSSRFAASPILVDGGKLTPEWKFLRDQNVVDLLHAVRPYRQSNNLPPKLIKAVPELEVPCLDGITRVLQLSAVPTADLKQQCPHLNFARLPEPTSKQWDFLSVFGVVTTCNTIARLRELRALSDLPAENTSKETVHEIYRALSTAMMQEKREIQ